MNKSLILGLTVGIVIGFVVGAIAVNVINMPAISNVEQYTVRLALDSGGSTRWYGIIHTYGTYVVFLQNNVTIHECAVYISPWTNITLSKGDYIMRLFDGQTGTFMYQREIYVMKDMDIVLNY